MCFAVAIILRTIDKQEGGVLITKLYHQLQGLMV